jgi:hypothetical protein
VAFLNSAARVLLARDPAAEEAAQATGDEAVIAAKADDAGDAEKD